ncbi:MAG: hypothetical protein GY816_19080 [Cytophagales bacterium]|nr:hypothetical protein [Cytophagales bacterium]
MSNLASAQNSPVIAGLYDLGSSGPEGGSHLVVLENGDYAITHFGGIQIGKWIRVEDSVFKFTPNVKENKFELYGRHSKDLGDKTKILFGGFENGETFIQLNKEKEKETTMQRVFNSGANCFSPPYVHTFETNALSISFMSIQYENPDRTIITITNPEGYNDFMASFIEVNDYESRPFIATFRDEELHFEEGNSQLRSPLDQMGEDLDFIKNLIEMESNRDTLYLNPFYNPFGQIDDEVQIDIHAYHVFNEQKNAFIDPEYYVEGVEHTTPEESYEDMSIIYSYSLLKEFSKKSDKYEINEESLFYASCD